jgi:hypothetical protein
MGGEGYYCSISRYCSITGIGLAKSTLSLLSCMLYFEAFAFFVFCFKQIQEYVNAINFIFIDCGYFNVLLAIIRRDLRKKKLKKSF